MAKVLLINPIQSPTRRPYPNIGLTYISAALKDEGADIECLDLNLHRPVLGRQEIERRIAERQFDIAAIGAMISAYGHVRDLCETIKRHHPESKVWVGGSIVSPIPRLMLANVPWMDVGVIDEGDQTVRELYRAERDGADLAEVAGIAYRDRDAVRLTADRPVIADLDTLPLPDWDIYQLTGEGGYLTTHGLSMHLVAHRGCPFECTYCYHERGSRAHSVDRVIEEIRRGVERYDARTFTMADDLFCADHAWVQEVCRRLIDLDLGITWRATVRANTMKRETLGLMKSAGCVEVAMGFESASPRILKNIRKHLTPDRMVEALRTCRQEGVKPAITFMIGNEGEDLGTIAESVDFMKRELLTAPMFFATPYPGTPFYESMRARGLIEDEIALFERYGEQGRDLVANATESSDEELIQLRQIATNDVRRHYDREHYKRIARERLLPHARRVAIVAGGYEGENMVDAYRDLFERLVVFSDSCPADGACYRGVPIRPSAELDASDFDAVVVADRTLSPATRDILAEQGVADRVIDPYDEAYFFSKCL